jgi:hypothetical protein
MLQREYQHLIRQARLAFDSINWHNPGSGAGLLHAKVKHWDTFAELLYARLEWPRVFVYASLCLPVDRSQLISTTDAQYIMLSDRQQADYSLLLEAFRCWCAIPVRQQTFFNLLEILCFQWHSRSCFSQLCKRLIQRWCVYNVDDCLFHVILCRKIAPDAEANIMTKLWIRAVLHHKLNMQWNPEQSESHCLAYDVLVNYFIRGSEFKKLYGNFYKSPAYERYVGWDRPEFDSIRPFIDTVRAILNSTSTT